MSNQPTPGPWEVKADTRDNEESLDYKRIEANGCDIASGILVDADAILIAAAPDMLEALQSTAAIIENYANNPVDCVRRIQALLPDICSAISKTEGRQ